MSLNAVLEIERLTELLDALLHSLSSSAKSKSEPTFHSTFQPKRFNLGQATLDFYDEREPELLTDDESDYLNHLVKRKTTEAQDEDEEFYNNHRLELKESQSLKLKWDHFIYGSPIESGDFIVGFVLCLEALFDNNLSNTKRKLVIRCDRRTKRDLMALNADAGLFFSSRYRGLIGLFGLSPSNNGLINSHSHLARL